MMRTIERWTHCEENLPEAMPVSLGGYPGSLTRAEYREGLSETSCAYVEAIWAALDSMNYTPTGEEHQNRFTPVFDDGTCMHFTYRGWGDLVSAWWNDKHPDELRTYVDFYM